MNETLRRIDSRTPNLALDLALILASSYENNYSRSIQGK